MRKTVLSIAAVAAVFALGLGGAAAQNSADFNDSTTVIQNHGSSPNTGQQGTGVQVQDSGTLNEIGDGSNFVDTPDDVAIGGVAAQAPDALAVGGDYLEVEGNSAGGNIFDVGEDGAYGFDGAVVSGALADGGGVAFGENFNIEDDFVAVGGNGVAAIAEDELVEDGSALVIGNGNSTASANDDAVAVGVNGNAIYVDEADDNTVTGFNNTVAMAELDQEYSAPLVAGPSADAFLDGVDPQNDPNLEGGAWGPTFALRNPDGTLAGSNQAYGTIETGQVSNISATDVAGVNDMFFSTGVGNQGHIGSVSAGINTITLN